mgnify:FL=1
MKDSILIPTDFSIASLNLLKQALNDNREAKRNFILVFDCNLSDSITDLLFLSKATLITSCSNETFNEGLEILKNRYADVIDSIRIEPFYGFTKAAFRNFLSANQIEETYLPTEEIVMNSHKDLKFFYTTSSKLNLKTNYVSWSEELEEYTPNTILQLFNA